MAGVAQKHWARWKKKKKNWDIDSMNKKYMSVEMVKSLN